MASGFLKLRGPQTGRNEDARHVCVAKQAMHPQIARSQAIGELERCKSHRQYSEAGMNRQVPLRGSVVLRDRRHRIKDPRVLFIRGKDCQRKEDREKQ